MAQHRALKHVVGEAQKNIAWSCKPQTKMAHQTHVPCLPIDSGPLNPVPYRIAPPTPQRWSLLCTCHSPVKMWQTPLGKMLVVNAKVLKPNLCVCRVVVRVVRSILRLNLHLQMSPFPSFLADRSLPQDRATLDSWCNGCLACNATYVTDMEHIANHLLRHEERIF